MGRLVLTGWRAGVHSRWIWGAPAGSWFLVKAGRQFPGGEGSARTEPGADTAWRGRGGKAWEPSRGRERWQVS